MFARHASGRDQARQTGRLHGRSQEQTRFVSRRFGSTFLLFSLVWLAGCSHKQAGVQTPLPPTISRTNRNPNPGNCCVNSTPAPAAKAPVVKLSVPDDANPIYVETGLASWYGPPYHNHRGANGEIYDMREATAAHRTIPLNSIVRVTNVANGRNMRVRITDLGTFIPVRILDLSFAAARELD